MYALNARTSTYRFHSNIDLAEGLNLPCTMESQRTMSCMIVRSILEIRERQAYLEDPCGCVRADEMQKEVADCCGEKSKAFRYPHRLSHHDATIEETGNMNNDSSCERQQFEFLGDSIHDEHLSTSAPARTMTCPSPVALGGGTKFCSLISDSTTGGPEIRHRTLLNLAGQKSTRPWEL